ncbi:MAG: PAS domain S-box protein [Syntrophobacteraceae bacterium]|nr:PAS domain S-box protein [Syntrophobacteraceae bacterium]
MKDDSKTKKQLLEELKSLREKICRLESATESHEDGRFDPKPHADFLQLIIDAIPSPVFYKGTDGLYRGCNRAFEELLGLRRSEIIGKTVFEIAPVELARRYSIADSHLFTNPGEQVYESYIQAADGSRRAVIFHKATFAAPGGTPLGLVGVILDITDRKSAESDLVKSKALFESLARLSPVGIFRTDIDGNIIYVNERWCEITGITLEEALGDGWVKAVHPEDRRRVRDAWYGSVGNNPSFRLEYRYQHPQGKVTAVLGQSSPVVNELGQIEGYVGTITDITEQKQTERALRESEARFRTIFDSVNEAIFIHEQESGAIIEVNRKTCEMYGYSPDEIRRLSVEDLSSGEPPYTQREVIERLKRAADGELQVFQWRAKDRSGRLFWVEINIRRAIIGKQKVLIVTGRDLSQRKEVENALLESEGRYRELFSTVPDAITLVDAETRRFIDANESALQLYGYPRSRFLELNDEDITADSDPSELTIQDSPTGGRTRVPLRYHRKKDGSIFPVEIASGTFVSEGRQVLVGVVRDISERKRVEGELETYRRHLEELVMERTNELAWANRQLTHEIEERTRAEKALKEASQKLKFFAYSVAHDLKSPAIGIYGLTRRLSKHASEVLDEKGRDYCDQILRASEHVAALVEKINIYISTKEARLAIEKVNIQEILQMLRDEFSVQLSIREISLFTPDIPLEIHADRLSILRAFRNLVDNSLKYGGERLSSIRIGYEESGDFHVFSVSDNGRGLREGDSEKIFRAFERTDTSGQVQGTGLGLAIVKEIAEQHGGRVWVENVAAGGAHFRISIARDL